MNRFLLLCFAFMIVNSNKQPIDTRNLGYLANGTSLQKYVNKRQILEETQDGKEGDVDPALITSIKLDSTSLAVVKPRCAQGCGHRKPARPAKPRPPVGDEGYYCPDKQRWLHPDSLIRDSTIDSKSLKWEEGDLVIQCVPSVTDFNCYKIGFKSGTSPGVISLSGWSVSAGSSSGSDGYVYQYHGLYKGLANKWEQFRDCNETKIFDVDIDCQGPELEDINPTVTIQELMLCPLKVTGNHPLFHVSVKGCLMRQHGPVEIFTLPEELKGKETCLSDEEWLGETDGLDPSMFYSNAGGYAPSAMYSQEGYPFPALADSGVLIGKNTEYFLEVDFPKVNSVCSLKVRGGADRGERGAVNSFTVAYRNMYAQGSWTYVLDKSGSPSLFEEKLPRRPAACQRPCPYTLEPPIVTSGIRIYPQTWILDKPYLRLDIKACQIQICNGSEEDEDYSELSDELMQSPPDEDDDDCDADLVQPPDSRLEESLRRGPRDTLSTEDRTMNKDKG